MSPAELAQLEHAFATDPVSGAYQPLAEAYLGLGRHMEAMVVCKKGIKAHPNSATPRLLLARVYADQGKDRKAIEELQAALQVAPEDASALRILAALHFKAGDATAGAEALRHALARSPDDAESRALAEQHGVALPAAGRPAGKAQAPVAAAPAKPEPAAAAEAHPAPGQAPVAEPVAPTSAPRATPSPAPQQRRTSPARQAPPAATPRNHALPSTPAFEPPEDDGFDDAPAPKAATPGNRGFLITIAIVAVGAALLGGYRWHAQSTAERERKIEHLLKQVQDELSKDSFDGYKKACDYGEQIVNDLDSTLYSAHAYLAYAYAIRWGEHGEGEFVEKAARDHLARAQAAHTEHSHILAAQAYIRFFGGDPAGARAELEQAINTYEAQNKRSPLLLSTLGILEMRAGELDPALRHLKAAQLLAPADPRISAAAGDVLRRQGNEFLAANAYEQALRYSHDHAEAQLGVALMAIDANKFETAEKYLKRLLAADPPPSMRQLALARLAMAIVLDEQNKRDDADKMQTVAFEADPHNGELFILKARRLMGREKPDEAVAAIREAIKLEPRRAGFYVELAKALVARPGGAKEAVASVQQALQTVPNSPKLLVLLGQAYQAGGDAEQARDSFQKALAAANDRLPEARMALADLARSQKDWAKALDLYAKAKDEYVALPERQAYALTEMGKIHEAQGDRAKALDEYKLASTVDTLYAPPLYLIGRMFVDDRDAGKRSAAKGLFEQYLKLAPKGEYAAEARGRVGR